MPACTNSTTLAAYVGTISVVILWCIVDACANVCNCTLFPVAFRPRVFISRGKFGPSVNEYAN